MITRPRVIPFIMEEAQGLMANYAKTHSLDDFISRSTLADVLLIKHRDLHNMGAWTLTDMGIHPHTAKYPIERQKRYKDTGLRWYYRDNNMITRFMNRGSHKKHLPINHDIKVRLIHDIHSLFNREDLVRYHNRTLDGKMSNRRKVAFITAKDICNALVKMEGRPWATWTPAPNYESMPSPITTLRLSQALRKLDGFEVRQVRTPTAKAMGLDTSMIYELPMVESLVEQDPRPLNMDHPNLAQYLRHDRYIHMDKVGIPRNNGITQSFPIYGKGHKTLDRRVYYRIRDVIEWLKDPHPVPNRDFDGDEIVYAFVNPEFDHLVKIGVTKLEDGEDVTQAIDDRIKALSFQTGVPSWFKCAWALRVPEEFLLEGYLHGVFGKQRHSQYKEYFRIKPVGLRAMLTKAMTICKEKNGDGKARWSVA